MDSFLSRAVSWLSSGGLLALGCSSLLFISCGKTAGPPMDGGGGSAGEGSVGGAGGEESHGPVVHEGPLLTGESWSRAWGEAGESAHCFTRAVAVDPRDGAVFVASWTFGKVNLDASGSGTQPLEVEPEQTTIVLTKFSAAGEQLRTWTWTSEGETEGNSGWGNRPITITVDDEGNIYLGGQYSGRIDFDPGPGVVEATSPVPGFDGFVLKLDAEGNLLWAKTLGSGFGRFVSVIPHGDAIYVSGQYRAEVAEEWELRPTEPVLGGASGTVVFGPYVDCFLGRLDAVDQSVTWTRSWGHPEQTEFECEVSLEGDELFSATDVYWRVRFNDPDGEVWIYGDTMDRMIVAGSYDLDGTRRWSRDWYGDAQLYPYDVLSGPDRRYAGGRAYNIGSGSTRYGARVVNYGDEETPFLVPLRSDNGYHDAFLVQTDEAGAPRWAKHWGGGLDAEIRALAENTSHVFAVGVGARGVDFGALGVVDSSDYSAFVVKLTHEGEEQALWKPQMGTLAYSRTSAALATEDSLYVLGDFRRSVDFGGAEGPKDRWSGSRSAACYLLKRKLD